jgi:hypothetical protein
MKQTATSTSASLTMRKNDEPNFMAPISLKNNKNNHSKKS